LAEFGPGVWRADLDGRSARTARQFLLSVGAVLGFPEDYGRNWDAFDECFGDLLDITDGGMGFEFGDREGRPENGLHLVVHHAEDLLVNAEPRDLSILIRMFREPYPEYDPPQPWHRYAALHVTLICAPEALETFGARFDAAERAAGDLW